MRPPYLMVKSLVQATLLFLLLPPSEAGAWGREAHMLVCGLAEQQLSQQAKTMVAQLIDAGEDLEGGRLSFVEACVWPDIVKHTSLKESYRHHFINLPEHATRINLTRDCPDQNCIARGIATALTQVSGNQVPFAQARRPERLRRAAALRLLGHYIADLHQPLHIGNASDRGGNRIEVLWFGKPANLHRIWDNLMPVHLGLTYPEGLKLLDRDAPATLNTSTIMEWMNDSLHLARAYAYVDHQGNLLQSGECLGAAYLERNRHVVNQQLSLAAARLAVLLHRIARGERPRID